MVHPKNWDEQGHTMVDSSAFRYPTLIKDRRACMTDPNGSLRSLSSVSERNSSALMATALVSGTMLEECFAAGDRNF